MQNFNYHSPLILDKRPNIRMDYSEKDEYLNSINKLKQKYNNKIEIETGFEVEYLPGEEKNLLILKSETDKIILGQHFIYDDDKNLKTFRNNNFSDSELIKYAQYIDKALELGIPDIIAHPDLFLKNSKTFNQMESEISHMICKSAEKYDIPLEINLSDVFEKIFFRDRKFNDLSTSEARKEINTRLNLVKKQLEEGASETEFRNRIKKLDMMEEANDRIAHVRKKIAENTKNTAEKEIMTELEVSQMLGELDRRIRALQSDVRTELENIIEDVINQGGQKIIEDYKKQMHLLISNGDLKTGSFNGGNTGIECLEETIPDAQELINQFKYTESRDTGETRRVRNEDHRWWDIFELFEPRMVTRKIFEDVEVVQVEEVYEEYIAPIVTGFNQNVASATKAAQQEAEKFKRFFLNELKTLNLILKKKVAENEKLTRDHESIERKIKEDQEKVQWLEQFLNKLDGILQI